jgi:hypothetical protein
MASIALSFSPLYSAKKHFFMDTNKIVADLGEKITLKDLAYVCIDHEALIPNDFFYEFLFPSSSKYNFSSLKKDDDGVIDFSSITDLDPMMEYEILNPSNTCERIMIDFEMDKKDDYKSFCNLSCNAYPSNIRDVMPRTFDIFYWSDFLLKYIYRMCVQIGFLKMDKDRVLDKENFMLGTAKKYSNGKHYIKVKSVRNISGFSELADLIESFVASNPVDEEMLKSREEFELSRTNSTVMKMYIQFNELDYSLESNGTIFFVKSTPKIVFTRETEEPVPIFCSWISLFIESNKDEIFKCFPIFTQLENIFRLQCVKRLVRENEKNGEKKKKEEEEKEKEKEELSFIDTFSHSIAISGGVDSEPKVLNQVPVDCKKAFDRVGLCSFRPSCFLFRKFECFDE